MPTHISDNKLSLKNDTGKVSETGRKSNEKNVWKVVGYPPGYLERQALSLLPSPSLAIPSSWYAWQVAAQLYSAIKVVDKHLPGFGQKTAARAAIERVLRAYKLPPATIKPWLIPPVLVNNWWLEWYWRKARGDHYEPASLLSTLKLHSFVLSFVPLRAIEVVLHL